MAVIESTLLALLAILAIGLIVPEFFKKLHLPFVTFIILLGAILGPSGLAYIELDETIEFFGFLGMTFLMLMAGMEADMKKLSKLKAKIAILALLNGGIPFIIGILITKYFGYGWAPSIIVGIVFVSSSVAVAIPTLKSAGLFNKNLGQLILSAVLLADITSLIALSFILQTLSPITKLPLPAYFILVLLLIGMIFFFIPKITRYLIKKRFSAKAKYEKELRLLIIVIVGGLLLFSIIGIHPILGAFILGMALSEVIKSEHLMWKIQTLGYGLFIPVFFFVVGMEMDLEIFKQFNTKNLLTISIILGLIFSKFISGFVGGKLIKLKNKEAAIFGSASIVQLTTTLAVAYTAATLNILDATLTTSLIILSIITTILGPIILSFLIKKS